MNNEILCKHCKKGYIRPEKYYGGFKFCSNKDCIQDLEDTAVPDDINDCALPILNNFLKLQDFQETYTRIQDVSPAISQNSSTSKEVELFLKSKTTTEPQNIQNETPADFGSFGQTASNTGNSILNDKFLENVWDSSFKEEIYPNNAPNYFENNDFENWITDYDENVIAVPTPTKAAVAFLTESPNKGGTLVHSDRSAFLQFNPSQRTTSRDSGSCSLDENIALPGSAFSPSSEDSGFTEDERFQVSKPCDSHCTVTSCQNSVPNMCPPLLSTSFAPILDDKLKVWNISKPSLTSDNEFMSALNCLKHIDEQLSLDAIDIIDSCPTTAKCKDALNLERNLDVPIVSNMPQDTLPNFNQNKMNPLLLCTTNHPILDDNKLTEDIASISDTEFLKNIESLEFQSFSEITDDLNNCPRNDVSVAPERDKFSLQTYCQSEIDDMVNLSVELIELPDQSEPKMSDLQANDPCAFDDMSHLTRVGSPNIVLHIAEDANYLLDQTFSTQSTKDCLIHIPKKTEDLRSFKECSNIQKKVTFDNNIETIINSNNVPMCHMDSPTLSDLIVNQSSPEHKIDQFSPEKAMDVDDSSHKDRVLTYSPKTNDTFPNIESTFKPVKSLYLDGIFCDEQLSMVKDLESDENSIRELTGNKLFETDLASPLDIKQENVGTYNDSFIPLISIDSDDNVTYIGAYQKHLVKKVITASYKKESLFLDEPLIKTYVAKFKAKKKRRPINSAYYFENLANTFPIDVFKNRVDSVTLDRKSVYSKSINFGIFS